MDTSINISTNTLTKTLVIDTVNLRNEVSIMSELTNVLKNIVSISMFNKGMAGKIFSDVKKGNTKIVMRNNEPECILLSPDEYIKLKEAIEDLEDLLLAIKRDANTDKTKLISAEDAMKELDITQEDLDAAEDVEIG